MTDEKENLPKNFPEVVDKLSMDLMLQAIQEANGSPTTAVAALVMAAGRAAGYSGLPMGVLLNMFSTQYEMSKDDSIKILTDRGEVEEILTRLPVKGGSN